MALAVAAVLVPAAMATDVGLTLLAGVVDAAQGLVLRDGQKWVALAVPGYSLAGAAAAGAPPVDPPRGNGDPMRDRSDRRPARSRGVLGTGCFGELPTWLDGGRQDGQPAPARSPSYPPTPCVTVPLGWFRARSGSVALVVASGLCFATGDLLIAGQTVPGEGAQARAVQELS